MTTRDSILGGIRRSLGVSGQEIDRRATVTDRLQRAPKGLIPERGQLPREERIALFETMARKVNATIERVDEDADVPKAVAAYLRDRNLASRLRYGDDPRLAGLPWETAPNLEISRGRSDGTDETTVSHAFGAVAESGTLVLLSGPDNPTTLNFLPEHHVVVVDGDDVLGDLETVWERLRAIRGKADMPRVVNLVTGPSRSGDIEQTILLGAHGPRALHIIVVDRAKT